MATQIAATRAERAISKIENAFNDPTHSDITIKVGRATSHAHLAILTPSTPFFANAVDGKFAESKDKCVTFPEHSAHAVWCVLRFCYSGEYPWTSAIEVADEDDAGLFLKHLDVYLLADMLGMEDLKTLAVEYIEEVTAHLDLGSPSMLVELIEGVYGNTSARDVMIRTLLVDIVVQRSSSILKDEGLQAVLKKQPDLSLALLLRVLNERREQGPYSTGRIGW